MRLIKWPLFCLFVFSAIYLFLNGHNTSRIASNGYVFKKEEAEKMLKRNSNNPHALRSLAIHANVENDSAKELQYLEQLVRVNPSDRMFKFRYAKRLLAAQSQSDWDKGVNVLRELAHEHDAVGKASQRSLARLNSILARK
jgi:hypothetical protein